MKTLFTNSKGDIETAEAMYRKSVQWRTVRRVDELLSWRPPSVLQKYYPWGMAGYDTDNCPVWIIPFGTADVKGKTKPFCFFSNKSLVQVFFYLPARMTLLTSQ